MKPSRKQNQPAAFKAQPNLSPNTSISNGGETHPSKIDALKNWFQTRPIVEKFCALPTYTTKLGDLPCFSWVPPRSSRSAFSCAQKSDCQHRADLHSGGLLVARFTDGYSFGLFSSFVGVVCVNFLFTYPYFALDFTMAGYRLPSWQCFQFQHYKRHHKQHENAGTRAGGT